MKVRVSAAMILFPEARHSMADMERALAHLCGRVELVEFYREDGDDTALRERLRANRLQSIFVAVIPLKEKGLNLCGLDKDNRRAAVNEVLHCVCRARAIGSEALMLCSGKKPARKADIPRCMDAFVLSMREIADFINKTGGGLRLLLEPCDSGIDARHLLGPTALSVEAVRRVRDFFPAFSLTMDSAHIAEENEDFLEAVTTVLPFCRHIHFANCVTGDRGDPLYGDKHVEFGYPGGVFSYAALARMYEGLAQLYGDADIDIAVEVLCRASDPLAHFDELARNAPFLFDKRGNINRKQG